MSDVELNSIPLSESAHDERILDGGPAERDCVCAPSTPDYEGPREDCPTHGRDLGEPYEPVCDTCSGNRYVYVHDGRSSQRQPCPDCILRGLA